MEGLRVVVAILVLLSVPTFMAGMFAARIRQLNQRHKRDRIIGELKYAPVTEIVQIMEKIGLIERRSPNPVDTPSHVLAEYDPFCLLSFQPLAEIMGSLLYKDILDYEEVAGNLIMRHLVKDDNFITTKAREFIRLASSRYNHSSCPGLDANPVREGLTSALKKSIEERRESVARHKREKIINAGLATVKKIEEDKGLEL